MFCQSYRIVFEFENSLALNRRDNRSLHWTQLDQLCGVNLLGDEGSMHTLVNENYSDWYFSTIAPYQPREEDSNELSMWM